MARQQETPSRHEMLDFALNELNERERAVLKERRLVDELRTLEELSFMFGISRERIRQIEIRAFEKLHTTIERLVACRSNPMTMALAIAG